MTTANLEISLAFGLIRLDGASGLEGWRWLFIVEGLMTAVVGIATFFLLPNDFETAYFLNEEERVLMRLRLQQSAHQVETEEFDIKEVWKTLRDPKTWLTSFNQICVNICSFGFSTFLPTIIRGFGYDSVKTQLLTVPVYIWASAFYLVIANLSDRVRMRAVFITPLCLVSAVGYAMLLGVDVHARGPLYFATYVCVTGYGLPILEILTRGFTSQHKVANKISQNICHSWTRRKLEREQPFRLLQARHGGGRPAIYRELCRIDSKLTSRTFISYMPIE